jgi:hypothetical protein
MQSIFKIYLFIYLLFGGMRGSFNIMVTNKIQLQLNKGVFLGGNNRQILPYFEEKRFRICHISIVRVHEGC